MKKREKPLHTHSLTLQPDLSAAHVANDTVYADPANRERVLEIKSIKPMFRCRAQLVEQQRTPASGPRTARELFCEHICLDERPMAGLQFAKDSEVTSMHPSFGMEYKCPSLEWKELMKGPSQEAVFAHLRKVLHYRSLFNPGGTLTASEQPSRK